MSVLSRGRKILDLARTERPELWAPDYESTKETTYSERDLVLKNAHLLTVIPKPIDKDGHKCNISEMENTLIVQNSKKLEERNTETNNNLEYNQSPHWNSDADLIEESEDSGSEYVPDSPESSGDNQDCESTEEDTCSEEIEVIPPLHFIDDNSDHEIFTSTIIQRPSASSRTKRIRQKNYCIYCEDAVTNFSRHIERNHTREIEVQKIMAKPKNSKERKDLFTRLRNQGSFLENSNGCKKPMKMPSTFDPNNYLPCTNCYGFYARKQLWRHRKRCGKSYGKKGAHQTEGQNLLLRNRKVDQQLKEQVFPRMRADNISLVAKSDTLICAFGARYLRIHREKHFINVTSRKMRELAKLLIQLRKLDSLITDMFSTLRPQFYDKMVEATKYVARYDPNKCIFLSPTYAMNISTSIKQCCDLAIMFALKKETTVSTAEMESDLKTIIRLIDTNWRYDISNQAADDLNMKTWNKLTIVPLASDIKMLKDYLVEKSEEAFKNLSNDNNNVVDFLTLTETVFCRVILLNRKRPGELQRMTLHVYETSGNKDKHSYEEFNKAVSVTENILMKRFKRVVIKGKRNRGVPVLFGLDVQEHIRLLTSVRSNFVPANNHYLFGKPNFNSPIYGYKVLQKYTKLCGAKNPTAITCTKLRKHLATLTQLLNMNDTDMEQLATFMGHTLGVHKNSYRLPDDVYQTAKLSKLLLLMEKGEVDRFRGKSLDEINLDDEMEADSDGAEPDNIGYEELQDEVSAILPQHSSNRSVGTSRPKKRVLIPWTPEQKKVVTTFFKDHIKNKRAAKRAECEKLIEINSQLLHNKDWLKIKVFVQNQYSK